MSVSVRVFMSEVVHVTVSTQKVWKEPLTIIASQPHSLLPLKMYGGGGQLVAVESSPIILSFPTPCFAFDQPLI